MLVKYKGPVTKYYEQGTLYECEETGGLYAVSSKIPFGTTDGRGWYYKGVGFFEELFELVNFSLENE